MVHARTACMRGVCLSNLQPDDSGTYTTEASVTGPAA